ncbi:hypothetical protein ACEQPO_05360 [Bacillus sp. SL00103]
MKIVRYAFDPEDDILAVTDVYTQRCEHELMKKKLLVYQKICSPASTQTIASRAF